MGYTGLYRGYVGLYKGYIGAYGDIRVVLG